MNSQSMNAGELRELRLEALLRDRVCPEKAVLLAEVVEDVIRLVAHALDERGLRIDQLVRAVGELAQRSDDADREADRLEGEISAKDEEIEALEERITVLEEGSARV